MPGPKVDSVLKSLREDHTFKNNQDIQKFYNKLEGTCDNNFSHPCIKAIPIKEEIKENVKKFYHKISENQSKLSLINDNFGVFKRELPKRCMYFKYWFYDQVITNGFDNIQIGQIFKLFENPNNNIEFNMSYLRADKNPRDYDAYTWHMCKIFYSTLDDIKKLKLSLDYIENYDKTKNTSTMCKAICNSEYKDYINEIIELCNNEFKKIHDINESYKMQCNVEDDSLFGGLHQARSTSPSTSLNVNRTILASFFIVAIFGIFSFLYKLTTFGPWLHMSVMKTNNSLFNPNENSTDILLNHISEPGSGNCMERPHYIAYHSYLHYLHVVYYILIIKINDNKQNKIYV
ncbi:PIR Superfamily Protein [Plasmodium ovale wallikeri]|uniref:PIR Superfamily Protein n=1 Tax=Plasmodium ovale wallikeri TaxID=864142 RepID=A0A1A9AM77_PLAOA|nr:PIR Superfamily Protein [Plasmodium ovale wallikeri]SBT57756.1 PIR Superfamily Protein [Plasmodium ovale wallikeri]